MQFILADGSKFCDNFELKKKKSTSPCHFYITHLVIIIIIEFL